MGIEVDKVIVAAVVVVVVVVGEVFATPSQTHTANIKSSEYEEGRMGYGMDGSSGNEKKKKKERASSGTG